jgi:hypothetical protein
MGMSRNTTKINTFQARQVIESILSFFLFGKRCKLKIGVCAWHSSTRQGRPWSKRLWEAMDVMGAFQSSQFTVELELRCEPSS